MTRLIFHDAPQRFGMSPRRTTFIDSATRQPVAEFASGHSALREGRDLVIYRDANQPGSPFASANRQLVARFKGVYFISEMDGDILRIFQLADGATGRPGVTEVDADRDADADDVQTLDAAGGRAAARRIAERMKPIADLNRRNAEFWGRRK
jgi:hypothetical protein